MTDEQIEELIRPTIDEIHDVLSGDFRKTLVFLRGMHVTEETADLVDNDYVKALMIDQRIFNDQFVRQNIFNMIKKRINDAKIGVVGVHGNYSIACGDPYALCQSIFGLPVTGLLKAGEIYNRYWVDAGAEQVVCFRAPMSTHSNIRKMRVASSEEMAKWYCHMTTCTMLNAWDSATAALNGMDEQRPLWQRCHTENRVNL